MSSLGESQTGSGLSGDDKLESTGDSSKTEVKGMNDMDCEVKSTNNGTGSHGGNHANVQMDVHQSPEDPKLNATDSPFIPPDLCEDGYLILDHVPFAEEFDRDSPFYHKGNETPVPFDMMRIPETMSTIYAEDDKRLGELIKQKANTENDPICIRMEQAVSGFHCLKKAWSSISDAVLLKASQVEASSKAPTKTFSAKADNAQVLYTVKVKGLVQEAANIEKNLQDNEYFKGFDGETLKMREFFTESLALISVAEAKKETKKRIEKLSKHFLTLQNSLIATLKTHKHSLNPSLSEAISSVLTATPVPTHTQASSQQCEELGEKPGRPLLDMPSPAAPNNEHTMQSVLRL